MKKFIYTALEDNTKLVEGEIEALDIKDARRKIRLLGLIPTKLHSEDELIQSSDYKSKGSVKFLSLNQKINFTSELETLLSSGISILESLESIEANSPDNKIQKICNELQASIKSGKTFAESLDILYGRTFGDIYISIVQTGEKSGELEKTLDRMLTVLKKQDDNKSKVINASIYPCILLAMLFILLVIFAKFVFPRFMGIISINGGELPPMARSIVEGMNFVADFWWLIILSFAALLGLISILTQNKDIKLKFDDLLLKFKVLSNFITCTNLSNFLTVLEISYDAGVPIMTGLELAQKTVSNLVLQNRIKYSIKLMSKGKTITEAFQISRAVPETVTGMIAAGEKSGNLGKMLKDAADVMDKKVDMALEALMRLFEPTVIMIIGIFVALVLLAFLQAYASMLGSLF